MSAAAKAHGMDGTLVEPDWPPITLAEAREVLARFPGCGEVVRLLSTSPRPFSAASVVGTTAGRAFVKRHHVQVRDREGLLEEHRFLGYLRGNGALVPAVLKDSSGETAIEIGRSTYEVHEVPAGKDLYEAAHSWTPFRSKHHAFSAGQALARLHAASRGYTAAVRAPRPLVAGFSIFAGEDAEAALHRYLVARPALADDRCTRDAGEQALELLAPFHAQLIPLLPALEPLWTHNDLHASNLLWSDVSEDAQGVAIIDFGLADRTNAVHDLAHAIERNVVEWLGWTSDGARDGTLALDFEALRALLAGYESVLELSGAEAAALAPMVALCHVEFALSEADYFLGVLHSPEKARLATDDYLVGHARWFRGRGGEKLLDAIRQWAGEKGRGDAIRT
jgi:Ser/Thr protein kinase RdoA (MazF antagonist)